MKTKTLLIWSTILLIFFAFFATYFNTKKSENKEGIEKFAPNTSVEENFNISRKTGEEFNLQMLDSLLKIDGEIMMLTIGTNGCDMCDILQQDDYYRMLNVGKLFIYMEDHPKNKLLAQILHPRAVPATYVIDKEYNLKGSIMGLANFQALLDSILHLKEEVFYIKPGDFEGVSNNSVPAMLSYSLKSLLAYWNHDTKSMKHNAQQSLKRGSYFFNNYLLYIAHKEENSIDSMRFYKKSALKYSTHGANPYLYEDLIVELRGEAAAKELDVQIGHD